MKRNIMQNGPFLKVKFLDLSLVLSHGPPVYTVSRIATNHTGGDPSGVCNIKDIKQSLPA